MTLPKLMGLMFAGALVLAVIVWGVVIKVLGLDAALFLKMLFG